MLAYPPIAYLGDRSILRRQGRSSAELRLFLVFETLAKYQHALEVQIYKPNDWSETPAQCDHKKPDLLALR